VRTLTLDFETDAIGPRPEHYPPQPAGVALLPEGGAPEYLAWGHPAGNNCTQEQATHRVLGMLMQHESVLCHNGGFDIAVMEERLGPAWRKHLDDTLVLAFMADPYAPSLGLKPLAVRHLGMAPEERDAVREWLIANKVVPRSATRAWGASIAKAPGDVVGPYAVGDVLRTRALFDKLRPTVPTAAYEREMRISRQTIDMERLGIFVDAERLGEDTERYSRAQEVLHDELRRLLRAPALDFNKPEEIASALESRYGVELPRTDKGRRKTDKATVSALVPDATVQALMLYESSLSYNLATYMRPFNEQAQATGGWVHAQWNAVRGDQGGGARTGRFSSSPNLQNLKDPEGEVRFIERLNVLHPYDWQLPSIRGYVVAPPGKVLIGRDYSQIELRVTAHYEDGAMSQGYRDDPNWDLHQWVIDRVKALHGVTLPRRIAKNIGFGIIYGAGGRAIAAQSGLPLDESVKLKGIYLDTIPSLRTLMNDVQRRGREGGFITTLGGRQYKVEPPRVIDGERRTFEYKLLNYLIQGSAADLIKEAMLEAANRFLDVRMTVHDEIVCYADKDSWRGQMMLLKQAMDENELVGRLDVPIRSEGYMGINWSQTEDVE